MSQLDIESKLEPVKREINSPEELIALFEHKTLREFSFDSGRMQLHVISEKYTSMHIKQCSLQIWTGNWYGFASQEEAYFLRKQFFKNFLSKAFTHPEVTKIDLTLDIVDVPDVILTLKQILSPGYSKYITYTLDFCSPGYEVSKNNFPQRSLIFKENHPVIAPHYIRNLFGSGINLYDSYPIYTNSPSTQLELSRAIAQKPWYKHKKSVTTAAIAKLIFILADYLFLDSLHPTADCAFYDNLFLVSHSVFLWTGNPQKLVHIKNLQDAFNRWDVIAQSDKSINIETIRTSLSRFMPMHDKEIVVITAEKRIAAINSILEAAHKKASHPQTPAEYKEILAQYARPQATLTISEDCWHKNQYVYENNLKDISFTSLEISCRSNVARMESLFKVVGKNNLINRVHVKTKPLDFEFFNIIIKNCLSLQALRLDLGENRYLDQLSDEVAEKVTEIYFNGLTDFSTNDYRPNLSLFNRP